MVGVALVGGGVAGATVGAVLVTGATDAGGSVAAGAVVTTTDAVDVGGLAVEVGASDAPLPSRADTATAAITIASAPSRRTASTASVRFGRSRVADGPVQGELPMTDVLLRGLGLLLVIALVALALSVRAA